MRRLPRRTVRVRLALLYAGFIAVCGIAVLLVPVFIIHGSTPIGATASDLAHNASSVRWQFIRALIILVALVAAALAVGWLVSGRFLGRLAAITATAKDISASNLNRRLALAGPHDEFRELGETLNGLFARLEASFEAQRHFVANASHELRTPLTAQRTLLQVALAGTGATAGPLRVACEQVLVLGDQQERLIDALLTLASSERGVEHWEPFDLASIASKILTGRSEEASRRGIHVETALTAAPAKGDPNLAGSLVANLVDNALAHNVTGGRAEITTKMTDGHPVIKVSNTGPAIAPGDVDRLFQPFQRIDSERIRHSGGHGLGLGLAIVAAIAKAHNATLTATARPEGGLDIEVSFR
ncbi:MAG TPA: HAMP domain-containing sensor histidine kinase [Streptosporangiaceae bacterium]